MEQNQGKAFVFVAVILSLGLILSAVIVSMAWYKNTTDKNSIITVTGSAKKQIKSDYAEWRGRFTEESTTLPDAYSKLNRDLGIVKEYLISKGYSEKDITVNSISTNTLYEGENYGRKTATVLGYILEQSIEIKSNDVSRISAISKESTELINKGVKFQSDPPQYFYTKLADLKVGMLADATKDAKLRAEQMASTSGRKVNSIRSAKMGVFQITRPNSTDVSDYGINDSSSMDKEITAVVNAEFSIK